MDGQRDEFIESTRLIPGHQLIIDSFRNGVLKCSLEGLLILTTPSGKGAELNFADTAGVLTERLN